MEDILGRVIGIFVACVLLFLIPVWYFGERTKTLEQMYLLTETTEFVDSIRMTGCLEKELYDSFLGKLGKLSESCEVKMVHKANRLRVDEMTMYLNAEEFYEIQIREALEKDGRYLFCEGDFFRVEIVKKSRGGFGNFLSGMLQKKKDSKMVSVYYGGRICYDGE